MMPTGRFELLPSGVIIIADNLRFWLNSVKTSSMVILPLVRVKCILHGKYDIFNAGSDRDEITIHQLAEIYKSIGQELFGYSGEIIFKQHEDKHYNTDDPKRRCPDLTKIKSILGYTPSVEVGDGVRRYLRFLYAETSTKNNSEVSASAQPQGSCKSNFLLQHGITLRGVAK